MIAGARSRRRFGGTAYDPGRVSTPERETWMAEQPSWQVAPGPSGPGRPRVVSVGSINQDLVIQVERLPDAGETLHGAELVSSPGGKGGNQAVAASRLGALSAMVARVGHDTVGVDLCTRLEADGVDTAWVTPTRETASGVALIVVRPDGENTITVAGGANLRLSGSDVRDAEEMILAADAVLLQLEVPVEANLAAVELARRSGALVSLNAAPLPPVVGADLRSLIASVDILVVNEVEAAQLLHVAAIGASEQDRAAAVRDLRALGPSLAVITLGSEGAIATNEVDTFVIASHSVHAVDGVGAGDAFCAGLALATIEGHEPREALRWAATCGALATTDVGAQTSLPRRRDVKLRLQLTALRPDDA
jgi:ribokinase